MMSLNYFAKILFSCALLATSLATVLQAEGPDKKPNIIFIITDDQGYGDLACHGHPFIKTPNLDKLYSQSTRFTNYHVSPTCAPTRAGLMSGKNPFEVGVSHTILERERMNPEVTTTVDILKKAGYTTGIFGKWHLGEQQEYQPESRGFDEVFIHAAGGIGQRFKGSQGDVPGNKYFDPTIRHNDTFVKTNGFCTDVFFQQALGWIKDKKDSDQPFFAFIPTNAPHSPFIAPDRYKELYKDHVADNKTRAFFGMISNIDDNVGLVMDKLEEWQIADNTLLIFTTDNGSALGSKIYNAGMKGGKGTISEGGSRVPLFFRLPGKTVAGQDLNHLSRHIDIMPTFAELVGVDVAELNLEGRSLLPLLGENAQGEWPDRTLFFHRGRWPKPKDDQKINFDKHQYENFAVRTNEWRLVGKNALYHIPTDAGETNNVIADNPEIAEKLLKEFDAFWQRTIPLLVNEYAPLEVPKPHAEAYLKQKESKGIPTWQKPEL